MSRLKSLLVYAGMLGSLFGFACTGSALAQAAPESTSASLLRGPEQRVALVIGNAHYRNAPQLANPDNDAQSMAQFLNKAGFEVTSAIDLTQNDMIRVVQDFSAKVAARGPNSVAMVYYAGHGVQLAGENYLVPVDANVSTPTELTSNSLRLVDLMATLESIPSRMRIVLLDACRNNPFPGVNDAGRGLAIVDAPNGSIVGYSTAPGTEALDGAGENSPYMKAFLARASAPNVPIEQLFKQVRLDVASSTSGRQIPWESSSLTSDFTFFGDTAVAATREPNRAPVVTASSNLPGRSVQQAYDFVVSEGQPQYYQQFIEMYPQDPLCDRIRWLLGNILREQAWHKAVLANSPFAYKTFADNFGNNQYTKIALQLHDQPKVMPLTLKQPISFGKFGDNNGQANSGQKLGGLGISLPGKDNNSAVNNGNGNTGINGGVKIVTLPMPGGNANGNNGNVSNGNGNTGINGGKIVTLPAPGGNANGNNGNVSNGNGNTGINGGRITTLPVIGGGKTSGSDNKVDVKTGMPANKVTTLPTTRPQINNGAVLKLNNGNNNQGNNRPQFNKTSSFGGNNGGNGGARIAMGGGQMRRGF